MTSGTYELGILKLEVDSVLKVEPTWAYVLLRGPGVYSGTTFFATIDYAAKDVALEFWHEGAEHGDGFITLKPTNWEEFLSDNALLYKDLSARFSRAGLAELTSSKKTDLPLEIKKHISKFLGAKRRTQRTQRRQRRTQRKRFNSKK